MSFATRDAHSIIKIDGLVSHTGHTRRCKAGARGRKRLTLLGMPGGKAMSPAMAEGVCWK